MYHILSCVVIKLTSLEWLLYNLYINYWSN